MYSSIKVGASVDFSIEIKINDRHLSSSRTWRYVEECFYDSSVVKTLFYERVLEEVGAGRLFK